MKFFGDIEQYNKFIEKKKLKNLISQRKFMLSPVFVRMAAFKS